LIELSVVLLILGGRTRLLADVMVENGTDYLQTFISDFDGVNVRGVPIDPATLGGTDTIIKRLADADVVSGTGAFDLLVSALQLETTTPTTFGGTLPLNTYFLTLSPTIPSTGGIMFNINAADTGGELSLFYFWMFTRGR
jgi:hypothetical protein